jgi:hypothetical protein
MPFKHESMHIPAKHDKRVKLSDQDKADIKRLYFSDDNLSQRDLARMYNVSRRSIIFAIYPERRIANYQARVARGGSKQYYDKDKHTEAMRTHRKHKQELYLDGKLIEQTIGE